MEESRIFELDQGWSIGAQYIETEEVREGLTFRNQFIIFCFGSGGCCFNDKIKIPDTNMFKADIETEEAREGVNGTAIT